MADSARIVVAWKGLPAYGARLIRAAVEATDEPVTVIGTRPSVPVEGIEEILGGPVIWIDDAKTSTWTELGLAPPRLFFETSWATPAFNSLADLTKKSGGKVVCFHDNNYKGNLRQFIGSAYYRLFLRKRYDAGWVPGSSGRRFCRFLGVSDSDIYEGVYSGWSEVFQPGPPLDERPTRILFVGVANERKAVDVLVPAWQRFAPDHPGWELHTFGQGPLQHLFESQPGLVPHPFLQSHEIAAAMRGARFVVMPSREDHWPLTIHEAASSGCGLLLSNNIGNRFDLAAEENALIFPAGDVAALEGAFRAAAAKSQAWLHNAAAVSVERASHFSPARFARTFNEICARFLPPR